MKQNPPAGVTGLTRALLLLLPFWFSAALARSAVSFADIQFWTGVPAGPGTRSAAVVIDWRDGTPGLVWGYRWPAGERRTGQDMLLAVLGADTRLNIDSAFFPNAISWDGRARSFDNNGTPAEFMDDRYWGYWVNNGVFFHPTDFNLNSHIVPPAEVVVPLGNPFDGGPWIESSTGSAGRELADGSWDGWAFGPFLTQPLEPVPAPVPEPGAGTLVILTAMALLRRRRRRKAVNVLRASRLQGSFPHVRRPCRGGASSRWLSGGFAALHRRLISASPPGYSHTLCWRAPLVASAALLPLGAAAQGPLPPDPAGPIPAASPLIRSWAESVESFQPGPQRLWESPSAPVSYGSPASVTRPADTTGESYPNPGTPAAATAPVLSLGDGGRITLRMARAVADGPGADFVVFENAVPVGEFAVFAELAFVEVSSNGTDFVRFPAQSLTPVTTQTGTFGTLDPRLVRNLAGKAPVGFGTPFDLSELTGTPGLDRQRVTHVRIIDVVGDVYSGFGSRDSEGRWINDPYPTAFATGGFDLDAVGVIHEAAADPWDDWRAVHFSTVERDDANVSGAGADPDGDSQPNILEYALRRDPRTPDFAPPVTVEAAAGGVTVRFARMADRLDVTFALERSTDGAAWEAIAVSAGGAAAQSLVTDAVVTGEEGSAPVMASVALGVMVPRMFFRLGIERTGS